MTKKELTRRTLIGTAGMSAVGMSFFGSDVHAAASPFDQVKTLEAIKVDVLVCGGGPSGMAAAVLAARQGSKVLLAERYGRMGGMAVYARVGPLMGHVNSAFVKEVLNSVGGRAFDPEKLDLQYASLVQDAGGDLLLHSWAIAPIMDGKEVKGAYLLTKGGILPVHASVTVDATGDGDVAYNTGAKFKKGRKEDGLMQPMTIMFTLSGVDPQKAIYPGSEDSAARTKLPAGIWAEVVTKANESGKLPENVGVVRLYRSSRKGETIVNAVQVNYVDGTDVRDLTKAEIEGRKQAYQILEFLREHGPGYEKAYISAMPACIGVRETRRFLGLEYLVKKDLITGRKRNDAVVKGASFAIDIHNPDGTGQAHGHGKTVRHGSAERVRPYDIPYGCLVPRDIDGLLLAGRCISGSHEAHASYRVQCIAMAIGAAAGAGAAVVVKDKVKPKNVNVKAMQDILF